MLCDVHIRCIALTRTNHVLLRLCQVMSAMAERMDTLLSAASKRGAALAFAVIVPAWERVHAWSALSRSQYLSRSFSVAAEEHAFVDGAQHRYPPTHLATASTCSERTCGRSHSSVRHARINAQTHQHKHRLTCTNVRSLTLGSCFRCHAKFAYMCARATLSHHLPLMMKPTQVSRATPSVQLRHRSFSASDTICSTSVARGRRSCS
jgi:hypothetical protein